MDRITVTAAPPESAEPLVLAIGKFDGVHIGHQAILGAAKADLGGARLAAMTFWPHPTYVLTGQEAYARVLTPPQERDRLLVEQGVERVYEIQFTREYASTPAETFVLEHLAKLRLRRVVVGEDFRFGQGGKATVEDLKRLCGEIGVPVTVVRAVEENGVKVSSSQIRRHLANGRVEAAEALLGRPYTLAGTVEHGDALGRQIGFPTANLGALEAYVIPKDGVYAASVATVGQADRRNWFAVVNVGTRPTVDGTTRRVEAHLFGFAGDLYDQVLRLSFLRRVRDERKFAGIEALKAQIGEDVRFVKQMLGML
ncbi:bifunctional riboflavin kinase/FAD synthetase [Alicyclobacillus cycloheptanicus]|uniref:Riboflavin biosynthesis protein n=1 Tax=Alicyclobacillus cycloheptanicus TaxID=1457 RepID=A0ABT9XGH1_9BACL|nr:bifunctional riboflavin kinase/FAD synthetase [Alicyclobacillus cycloheptanicus]MDQ0189272.1 riboflavin kinase/FMN adenylyltransferase [Alicyclobacillus cycloheptanicus]WDM01362.1 bifunctional riboflavin kinase/FAD synthetase [Alicyclobacillus cycloheptanicus]